MVRWLGIDYGTRRIGLALSDHRETIASPITTLNAAASVTDDARRILRWAAENEVAGIVVGLPINMDGSLGPQAGLSRNLARHLQRLGHLPVELWDERLSSFQADELLRAAGLTPAKQKKHRDALAAQVILQAFLDARRTSNEPPQE